jgi:hydroxypyruvate isomerase
MQSFAKHSRRTALKALGAAAGMLVARDIPASTLMWKTAPPAAEPAGAASPEATPGFLPQHTGRIRQSVCRWPYSKSPLSELCRRAKEIGFAGIDLLYPDEWPSAAQVGLVVSMGYASRRPRLIENGFNDPTHHTMLIAELAAALPLASHARVPNLIAMFGNRVPGIGEDAAIANCVAGLKRIAPLAERHAVTICVELLNSKVDHAGYQGDHTVFGAAVVRGVNSPRVKLLYDIYHMQIMEGDVIRTIRENLEWIGHFHTGGVPGRHEIDDSQELNYRAIASAIADANYQGYLAHEFVPTRADPFESLAQAFSICTA